MNERIRELTQLIAAEHDSEKFTELVAELNRLPDETKSPTQLPQSKQVRNDFHHTEPCVNK